MSKHFGLGRLARHDAGQSLVEFALILPILLLETASPLLIDQPEDNLDNAFIYETRCSTNIVSKFLF